MKANKLKIVGFFAIASLASAFGSSKYSGIYILNAGGKVLLAITGGGHALSLTDKTTIANELTPAKSTVDSSGKLIGSSANGLSVVAQIASNFTVTGTAKGDETVRITGSRKLN